MSRLLTSGGNLSLPYRMNSTNNSFERFEMTLRFIFLCLYTMKEADA